MTQTEMAKKLGISRTYLNGILNGKRKPSIKLAKKIAKLMGISYLELRKDIKEILLDSLDDLLRNRKAI